MRLSLAFLALVPSLAIAATRPNENNLTKAFAQARLAQVRSVSYSLELTFAKGKEEYSGKARIDASLADVKKPLSLDWLGKAPAAVAVNGTVIRDFKAQTGSLEIPARYLDKRTVIAIEFTNEFGKEGSGIQHVTDPEDKEEYVYTDFEPYGAHELFPCFDQPDLKAAFDLTITAPADWKVIGNSLPREEKATADGARTTTFERTSPISTYLFFVGAGAFVEWKDMHDKTPLYLHARKSLAKYVDADNLFATMKKGLTFYSGYFGFEYPFPKFGLVFAPEFGWGGMENPGAIVTNEKNLFRGPVPISRREGRDSLILHEMAHHWFGDLVTMKWWGDLWLNESFATYMASLAQDRAFGSKMVWQDFAGTKTWGYWQDQLVTTHPIETPVADVRTARGNFDGITYAKGGAALQQLHFFVGEEAFRNGVQAYFRKHAFHNAERADFVGAIAEAAGKDLKGWTHAWLQTAGLNRVSVTTKPCADAGKVCGFTVNQEKSSSGTLSPHRARVGFFVREPDGQLRLSQSQDVAYEKAKTEVKFPENAAPAKPDFVFPNLDDKDYALFALDAGSLDHAESVLSGEIRDPLLRLQVWNALSQMVRDGKLAPTRYLEIAIAGLNREEDDGVLSIVAGRHSPMKEIYEHYLSKSDREQRAPALESTLWFRIAGSEKGASRQLQLFDFFLRVAQTPENLDRVAGWLSSDKGPEGIALDQERRWLMVMALASHGHGGAVAAIENEEKRDPSDLGKRSAYAARVALPSKEAKQKFWEALEHPEKIPPTTLRSAAGAFHQPNQLELTGEYVKSYFARLKKVDWKKSDQLVEVYLESLFPGNLCSKQLLELSRKELKSGGKQLTDYARRAWLEANDELGRCVKVGRR